MRYPVFRGNWRQAKRRTGSFDDSPNFMLLDEGKLSAKLRVASSKSSERSNSIVREGGARCGFSLLPSCHKRF